MPTKKKTEEAESEWEDHKTWFTIRVPVAARSTATFQWGGDIKTKDGAEYLIEHCVTPERVKHRCVIIEHCEKRKCHKTTYKKKSGRAKGA